MRANGRLGPAIPEFGYSLIMYGCKLLFNSVNAMLKGFYSAVLLLGFTLFSPGLAAGFTIKFVTGTFTALYEWPEEYFR